MLLANKDITRFWTHVQKSGVNDCWPWTGPTKTVNKRYTPMTYGAFTATIDGKSYSRNAHRYAWIIANKQSPPAGWVICHHCDNPLCCNPGHLFAGTRADNQRDMQRKLRSGILGTKNPKAKFTEAQVLEIRASDESDLEVARRYGVAATTIYMLRVGRKWRNLPGAKPKPPRKVLTPLQRAEIFRRRNAGEPWKQIAVEVGVSVAYACTLYNSARE